MTLLALNHRDVQAVGRRNLPAKPAVVQLVAPREDERDGDDDRGDPRQNLDDDHDYSLSGRFGRQ